MIHKCQKTLKNSQTKILKIFATGWQYFKACVAIFIRFLFTHQMIALQKPFKMFFISSKKLFRSQDIEIFIFSLPIHTFQIQKNKWKWNNL